MIRRCKTQAAPHSSVTHSLFKPSLFASSANSRLPTNAARISYRQIWPLSISCSPNE